MRDWVCIAIVVYDFRSEMLGDGNGDMKKVSVTKGCGAGKSPKKPVEALVLSHSCMVQINLWFQLNAKWTLHRYGSNGCL